MLKVSSSCVLLTALVFSSAHAPTFQLWDDLPGASAGSVTGQETNDFDAHAGTLAYASYALTRQYDEDNDLERFELDELFLPKLNVDLPELFDWSDGERAYLASNTMPGAFGLARDNPRGFAFRNGRASGGFGASGAGGSESNGKSASGSEDSGPDGSTCQASEGEAGSNKAADEQQQCEPSPTVNPPVQDDPNRDPYPLPPSSDPEPIVDAQRPVQVPAPGSFGLFVLGLAALRFVGRKKSGSG